MARGDKKPTSRAEGGKRTPAGGGPSPADACSSEPGPSAGEADRHHAEAASIVAKNKAGDVLPGDLTRLYWELAHNASTWVRLSGKGESGHRPLAAEFHVEPSSMKNALLVYRRFPGEAGRARLLALEFEPRTFPPGRRKPPGRRPRFGMLALICEVKWRDDFEDLLSLALKENWTESEAKAHLAEMTPKAGRGIHSSTGIAKAEVEPWGRPRCKSLVAGLRAAALAVQAVGQDDPDEAGRGRRADCYEAIEAMAQAIGRLARLERSATAAEAAGPAPSRSADDVPDEPA